MCILLTFKITMNGVISFQDFCTLESVSFCISQLRGNRRRNIKSKNFVSTQKSYLYGLWNFHYWLVGQKFSYSIWTMIGNSTFQKQSKTVTLGGLEHFFNLYESNNTKSRRYFTQLIMKYLRDPIHKNKKSQTLRIEYHAIKAYFELNDSPIHLRFRLGFTEIEHIEEPQLLTLGNLMRLLTVGQPTLLQKAVFLCKFHRGLDTSTFVDRFNFEAWD